MFAFVRLLFRPQPNRTQCSYKPMAAHDGLDPWALLEGRSQESDVSGSVEVSEIAESSASSRQVSLHRYGSCRLTTAHGKQVQVATPAAAQADAASHPCGWCSESFLSAQGRAGHERFKHKALLQDAKAAGIKLSFSKGRCARDTPASEPEASEPVEVEAEIAEDAEVTAETQGPRVSLGFAQR